jgi:hypothetical protein
MSFIFYFLSAITTVTARSINSLAKPIILLASGLIALPTIYD